MKKKLLEGNNKKNQEVYKIFHRFFQVEKGLKIRFFKSKMLYIDFFQSLR